jgi:hypothetical protein
MVCAVQGHLHPSAGVCRDALGHPAAIIGLIAQAPRAGGINLCNVSATNLFRTATGFYEIQICHLGVHRLLVLSKPIDAPESIYLKFKIACHYTPFC